MDDLVGAARMQGWYPLAVMVLMVLLQIMRKHPKSSPVWQKIPDGFRWVPGVVLGFGTGFVAAFQSGALATDALLAGVGGIFGITIPAMGLAAGLRESPIPWDGGPGGKPKKRAPAVPLVMLALMLALPVVLPSCTRPVDAKTVAAYSETVGRAAYNAAVVGLEYMDEEQAERVRAMRVASPLPTEAEFQRVAAQTERLVRIRAALALVRTELESKTHGFSRDELVGVLTLLLLAIDEARADGKTVPDSIRASILSARALLGAP